MNFIVPLSVIMYEFVIMLCGSIDNKGKYLKKLTIIEQKLTALKLSQQALGSILSLQWPLQGKRDKDTT